MADIGRIEFGPSDGYLPSRVQSLSDILNNTKFDPIKKEEVSMDKFYRDAIDILAENTFDAKRLAIELAKVNPALFVSLCRDLNLRTVQYPWAKKVADFVRAGCYVESIKELRARTGLGLKEAKDIIDSATGKTVWVPTDEICLSYREAIKKA